MGNIFEVKVLVEFSKKTRFYAADVREFAKSLNVDADIKSRDDGKHIISAVISFFVDENNLAEKTMAITHFCDDKSINWTWQVSAYRYSDGSLVDKRAKRYFGLSSGDYYKNDK